MLADIQKKILYEVVLVNYADQAVCFFNDCSIGIAAIHKFPINGLKWFESRRLNIFHPGDASNLIGSQVSR